MKKITLSVAALLLVVVACKTKKSETASTVKPEVKEVALIDAAKKKYPDITQAELDEGQKIYTTDCVRCHGDKGIETHNDQEWNTIIDRMAPKAKLNPDQKTRLVQYVISVLIKAKK